MTERWQGAAHEKARKAKLCRNWYVKELAGEENL
jgi:hypothetical protein